MKRFKRPAGPTRPRPLSTGTFGLLALAVLAFALAFAGAARSAQSTVNLGGARSFGALSATAMTNAGSDTVVHGNVGSATSIDAGVTHPGFAAYGAGSPELANAQAGLLTAYGFAEAATPTQPTITGVNLAGKTLVAGVYNSTSSILISGPIALTLDGGGDSNSVFIFQAASSGDLTVDPTSSVTYTNGAQPCNVFWKVNSAFLKNSNETFVGTILALTQITLTDNITVEGRLLARNADVTFIHDTVNRPNCSAAPAPAPASPTPAPAPSRALYCDSAGTSYNLIVGQDKTPPYAALGLVPAYTDPITGSKSCTFPTPLPTPEAVAAAAAAAAAAQAAQAAQAATAARVEKAAAAAKAARARARTPSRGHARPPLHRFGLTG
jgi:type VI secretion system secreted protein VgrG